MQISEKGQNAKSIVRPLEVSKNGRYSIVEVELVTGRTHQIRVHLAGKGYPLIGDSKYGVKYPGITTQLLHAYRLVFGEIPQEYYALQGLSGLEIKAGKSENFERTWEKINR